MDEPRPFFSPDTRDCPSRDLKVMEQGVDQRSGPVSRSRMHDDPRRLVEDQQVIIFEEHFERNRLALELKRLRLRNIHGDLVTGFDLLAGPDDLIVDTNTPEFNEPLKPGAGHLSLPVDEKDVDPLGLFSGCHQEFRNHVRHTLLKSLGKMQSAKPRLPPRSRSTMLSLKAGPH